MEFSKIALLVVLLGLAGVDLASSNVYPQVDSFFQKSQHTNNWAVLVCTSRFWFNYRHVANALSLYRSVKRLGIPDSHIILMLADDMACNPRNPRPAKVYNNKNEAIDVYGSDVEVDYRGYEVTVENFIRVLTGRLPPDTPRSKRLDTDDRSNIVIYMTGHGGEDFLKFQDAEEISNVELADAFEQMWQKQRYNELLFIIDTCQAASMYAPFYSPNIVSIASSQIGEDSLSHHMDPAIGVYIIDRYTYYLLEFLEGIKSSSKKTLEHLFKVCPRQQCISTPSHGITKFKRPLNKTLIMDFFGNEHSVEVNELSMSLPSSASTGHRGKHASAKPDATFQKIRQFPELLHPRSSPPEPDRALGTSYFPVLIGVLLLLIIKM